MSEVGSPSSLIDEGKLRAVQSLCRHHHVRRLDLFGSAVTGHFDVAQSDLDMLVAFDDLSPGRYADAYFGLKGDLEGLFGREVDLITGAALQNPFFRREVETHRRTLFVAG
jgi:hypothetical protein